MRLKPLLVAIAATAGLLAAAIGGTDVTNSAFASSTSTTATADTPSLAGPHAPRDGVAKFAATAATTGCDVSWSSLDGGTAVADRFELLAEPSGSVLHETAAGDVSAGSYTDTPAGAVSSYLLRTRAATTWVSPPAQTATTTCVAPGQISVDAGDTATCGIRADQTLWCWGFGQRLTTGDDDYLTTSTPGIESAASWRQVNIAIGHGCGIQVDATLWCWGDNWIGQLGNGTTTPSTDPAQVGSASDWLSVHTFGYTTCGLRAPGTLWCWGRNDYGQAGNGTTAAQSSPVQIGTDADWDAVAGGPRHACGVRAAQLYCWGQNLDGELGDGTNVVRLAPVQVGEIGVWSSSISLGEQHSCAVQVDGTLWCWGTNWFGEGGSTSGAPRRTPTLVGADSDWAQVAAGRYITCAIKIDRTVWCTGTNLNGVTGQALTSGRTESMSQVGTAAQWAVLTVGSKHVCGIQADASLWCWGSNNVGQSGQPNTTWQSPQPASPDSDWAEVQAGYNHSCARKVDQTLWCLGENSSAQLGVGTKDDGYYEPTQVAGGGQWISHEAGDFHSCGIKDDNTLWCWGRNSAGQLGTGGNVPSDFPVQVGTDADWVQLGTGRQHNCAIKINGTLWCWGANDAGTVGDGTTTDALAPVQIGSASNWASVDAGFRHSCGVRLDRTLWCWGVNGSGQVGDGTWTDRVVPTRVDTRNDWTSVGSGRDHSCATRETGTLWCWGRGTQGQLGDGTTSTRPSPVQVGSSTMWSSADGGHNYSCGRQTDDTLWCWGRNAAGNFGSGTVGGISTTPTRYHSSVDSFAVSTGHWHTCAITVAGSLLCWGANYSGQLGYTSSLSVPVEVVGGQPWTP